MSQSDYLRYKKLSTELKKNHYDETPVFNTQDYTELKQYSLGNTLSNSKNCYNQLVPNGRKRIFDMEKKVSNCPTFIICNGTDARSNRVPMGDIYYTPKYVGSYVKQPSNAKTACNCILNSVNTERYICKCKTTY